MSSNWRKEIRISISVITVIFCSNQAHAQYEFGATATDKNTYSAGAFDRSTAVTLRQAPTAPFVSGGQDSRVVSISLNAERSECARCGETPTRCNCSGGDDASGQCADGTTIDSFGSCTGPSFTITDCDYGVGCMGFSNSRVSLYGEFLYLRPRNAEVAYAVPIDGPVDPVLGNGIPFGPTALVDIDNRGGFRTGLDLMMNDQSWLRARYTHFDGDIHDETFVQTPRALRSLVTHHLGNNAAVDTLRAAADYDINFDLADVTIRSIWKETDCVRVGYVAGVRLGELEQVFRSEFGTIGATSVDTDLSFDGAGPRIGLELDRRAGCLGLFVYGRGYANFLVGKVDARYNQSDVFAGSVVDTSWESGRIVTQLELETGFGWATQDDVFQLSAGYLVSSWFNTVRTDEFINAVQRNQFSGLGDGITFDGFVVRAELRF